jgi:hypothetical protein
MIQVPPDAEPALAGFDLAGGEWIKLDLEGLTFGGIGLINKDRNVTGGLVQTTDFDVDIDGPGGDTKTDKYWQGATSLRTAAGASLDSRQFPGFVMSPLLKAYGARLGDFGVAIWNGRMAGFQVYDIGPARKAGEGSIYLARKLGIVLPSTSDHDAATNGNNVRDVVSIIFTKTAPGSGTSFPNHAIAADLVDQACGLVSGKWA